MNDIRNEIQYLQLNVNNLEEIVKLIKLYENVFEMEPFEYPSHDYLEKILKNQNIIFMVAKYEDEIIAGLTAHQLASIYCESNEVYVYDLLIQIWVPHPGGILDEVIANCNDQVCFLKHVRDLPVLG